MSLEALDCQFSSVTILCDKTSMYIDLYSVIVKPQDSQLSYFDLIPDCAN